MYSPVLTYSDVEKRLLSMPRFQDVGGRAARFGIDQISEFCNAVGNPERSYRIIHVAGTNGKGTVSSIIASLLKEAGFKTGLYTSPHLKDVRERFRINGEMVSKERITECFSGFEKELLKHPLTFFELTTAMAFKLFELEKVDFAVIETGLGGRLDATNIVNPVGCAITSIGFDHMEQLGNTMESIAFEKAGILKPYVPFVLGEIQNSAREVILRQADTVGSEEIIDSTAVTYLNSGMHRVRLGKTSFNLKCDLNTPKIEVNIRIAIQLVRRIVGDELLTPNVIKAGLSAIRSNSGLLGRFEKITKNSDWYFDGGHNTEALKQVISHLNRLFPNRAKVAVLSLMADKMNAELISCLEEFTEVYFYELDTPRALKASDFLKFYPSAKILDENLGTLKKNLINLKSALVLFTGSFYFYSTVTEWMESLSLDSN